MTATELAREVPASVNRYMSGVHAPLRDEITIEDLVVTGTIPSALDGRYLRMGPNPMETEEAGKRHWFAGDGMVHGLCIENGRALWYRNRWIRSDAIADALMEPRTPGPRALFDTVNTNAMGFAGKVLGLVESGGAPVEIGETLETLTYTDFDGGLHGGFAAHPHIDPLTGEMLAICYDADRPDALRFVAVTPEGQVRREVGIPAADGPMIHDFAFTARFAIIFDLPVTLSASAAAEGYSFPYRWNNNHAARVGLLPREGGAGDIIWCPVDPCFIFHAVNAFDGPDGQVIVDVVVHDRMFWNSGVGPDSGHCALERWTIDPVTGTVARAVLDNTPQEFPRPDERRLGQPYRFAYTMALTGPFLGAGLYKHDLAAGSRQFHDFGPNRHPGEFVFVPSHAAAEEDEGWLIGMVIDAAEQATELVILDARNFDGEALAAIRLPHIVPPGFHGNWVPAQV